MRSNQYKESYLQKINIKQSIKHWGKIIFAGGTPAWSDRLKRIYRAYLRYYYYQKNLNFCRNQFNVDRARFERHAPCFVPARSDSSVPWDRQQFHSIMTIEYHRLEKGLALPEPRPGFGLDTVRKLSVMVDKYIEKFGFDDLTNICLSVLEQYFQFNQDRQIANPELETWIGKTNQIHGHIRGELQTGGSHSFTKQELVESTQLDLSGFFASRHSIRNFTNDSVSLDLISQGVQMAQFTPSVCNRQAARVSVLHTTGDKQKALSYQNGNRGFGHTADKVLVISSNLKSYNSVGERNQCWIDGGMFAMSLVYALHSLGLGTCCLNWCVENDVDRSFKQELDIPDSDAIAMLILVGHMPDKIQVATSRRKHLEEVLFVHN